MVDLPRKGESHPNNVPFRGVQRAAFDIRDEARLLEGRHFEPGVREVVVGRKAAAQFAGLAVGSRIGFRDSDWTVVGIFESGGDVHESEIWADAEVALSAFRRTGYQSVTARLADGSDAGLAAFRDAVSRDRRFSISVLREPEYYAKQAGVLSDLINVLGYTVATFMAVGATFGALNCMYSAIASRQVEIATLRAIGFGGAPVVVSVMIEALLLSLLGGAVGGGAGLCLLRRGLALHAQLQHLLAGGLRLPRDAGSAPPRAHLGPGHRPGRRAPARGTRRPHPGHRGAAHLIEEARVLAVDSPPVPG